MRFLLQPAVVLPALSLKVGIAWPDVAPQQALLHGGDVLPGLVHASEVLAADFDGPLRGSVA